MHPLAVMPPPKYWGEIDRAWGLVAWPLLAMFSVGAAWLVARAALKRHHSNHIATVRWSGLSFGLVAAIPCAMISQFIGSSAGEFIIRNTSIVTSDNAYGAQEEIWAVHVTVEILTCCVLVPLNSALGTAGLLALTRGLWSTGGPPAFRVEPGDPTGGESDGRSNTDLP